MIYGTFNLIEFFIQERCVSKLRAIDLKLKNVLFLLVMEENLQGNKTSAVCRQYFCEHHKSFGNLYFIISRAILLLHLKHISCTINFRSFIESLPTSHIIMLPFPLWNSSFVIPKPPPALGWLGYLSMRRKVFRHFSFLLLADKASKYFSFQNINSL